MSYLLACRCQALAYARRLLALNDEAWGRLTHPAFEGTLNFGVPHDIIFPHVPVVLQRFAAESPRVKLQLHSVYTSGLKERLHDPFCCRRDSATPCLG